MTIEIWTGFPGSGKSYAATKEGINFSDSILGNGWVVANFPVKQKKRMFHKIRKKSKFKESRWIFKDNEELTVEYLVKLSFERGFHKKEGSCLVIFDEASMPFNSRDWSKPDRKQWIKFLSQHRKFGYDFIMIAQDVGMIDKQIRALAEYEVRFRRLNNSFMFKWLSLFKITLFAAIRYWNGMRYGKGVISMYIYRNSIGERYDTANLFGYVDEFEDFADYLEKKE